MNADPAFWRIFKSLGVSNNQNISLNRPDGVILTASSAERLFGTSTPSEETLIQEDGTALPILKIIPDLPQNTHLDFDLMIMGGIPLSTWSSMNLFTYVKLKEFDIKNIEEKLTQKVDELKGQGQKTAMVLII